MIQTILLIGALVLNPGAVKETFEVDKETSKVTWKGEKVTGFHEGTIEIKEGGLEYVDGKLTGGKFVIDMTTIESDEELDKLEGHLKSDDFFGVATYPTATFVITEVVNQGPKGYNITGDITIKGITKEIKFVAKINDTAKQANATAEIVLDRSEFNVRFGSGSFFDGLGDKMIYDNFTLGIDLVVKK
ncbi:MAG: YceI family protein [Cyclobacteriaceae bacterium]